LLLSVVVQLAPQGDCFVAAVAEVSGRPIHRGLLEIIFLIDAATVQQARGFVRVKRSESGAGRIKGLGLHLCPSPDKRVALAAIGEVEFWHLLLLFRETVFHFPGINRADATIATDDLIVLALVDGFAFLAADGAAGISRLLTVRVAGAFHIGDDWILQISV